MYMVLLGPPGSGKGTQAKLLSKRIGNTHLSTGDLLRDILSNANHPLYPDVQIIKEGKLVSDEVVNRVIEDGLKNPLYEDGIIFDGYPRTVAQAQVLDRMLDSIGKKLDVVIDLHVTEEVLLGRLLGRRTCPECRGVFHVSQGYNECPHCKVPLTQRDDDNEEVIMERFKQYHIKTEPIQSYYRNKKIAYIVLNISDASLQPEDVQMDIIKGLSNYGLI